jgi:hypothetical protein
VNAGLGGVQTVSFRISRNVHCSETESTSTKYDYLGMIRSNSKRGIKRSRIDFTSVLASTKSKFVNYFFLEIHPLPCHQNYGSVSPATKKNTQYALISEVAKSERWG